MLGTVAITPLMAQGLPGFPSFADWPMFGQNPANTASNAADMAISVHTVASLKTKWTFTTALTCRPERPSLMA